MAPLLRTIVVRLKVVESVILDAEERLTSDEVVTHPSPEHEQPN